MESPQGLMASGDLSEVESLKRKLQRETASQQEKEELIWTLREVQAGCVLYSCCV